MKVVFAIVCACLLQACSSIERITFKEDEDVPIYIIEGTSTVQDVIDRYGKPDEIIVGGAMTNLVYKNVQSYYYVVYGARETTELRFIFKDGVLLSSDKLKSERGWRVLTLGW